MLLRYEQGLAGPAKVVHQHLQQVLMEQASQDFDDDAVVILDAPSGVACGR